MIDKKEEIIAKLIGVVVADIVFFSLFSWFSMPWYLNLPLVFFIIGPLWIKVAYK